VAKSKIVVIGVDKKELIIAVDKKPRLLGQCRIDVDNRADTRKGKLVDSAKSFLLLKI
jgi:hypothetical protein